MKEGVSPSWDFEQRPDGDNRETWGREKEVMQVEKTVRAKALRQVRAGIREKHHESQHDWNRHVEAERAGKKLIKRAGQESQEGGSPKGDQLVSNYNRSDERC